MPAKCTHPHQTCSGSNSNYVKISCSSCGAVLYQNYLAQIDKELFRRKFRALEERMTYGVKDEKDLARELLEMLKANPEMHWQDHRSLVEILAVYIERKESEEAPKLKEAFIPGTCQPKCSHPPICAQLGRHSDECLMRGIPMTPLGSKAPPAVPPLRGTPRCECDLLVVVARLQPLLRAHP